MKKLIILDRDGVINQESREYIKNPDEFIFLPQSIDAISMLTKNGYIVAITTNQSGVGRGYFSQTDLDNIHKKMTDEIEDRGGKINQINFCPHLPDEGCKCRKPKTGMIENIEKRFNLSVKKLSPYLVGDSPCDMELAINAGCKPCLVKTGDGIESYEMLSESVRKKVTSYENLMDVVKELVGEE